MASASARTWARVRLVPPAEHHQRALFHAAQLAPWGVTTATCSSRRPGEAEAGVDFDELRVDFDVVFSTTTPSPESRARSELGRSRSHASPTHAHPARSPSNTARSSASAKSFPPSHTLYPPWKNARSSAGDAAAPAEASDGAGADPPRRGGRTPRFLGCAEAGEDGGVPRGVAAVREPAVQ